MIEVVGLHKSFPQGGSSVLRRLRGIKTARRPVLNNIDLAVGRGELVGLLGGNGAGKTSLLQILATLSRGDSGSVTIGGASAEFHPEQVRKLIGFCGSADRGFYYRMSVRDNLLFFGTISQQLATRALNERIGAVLQMVDLEEHANVLYAYLSTGMRQRLAVARALLGDPHVLIFDEPTRAVDPIHADSVRKLIRETLVDRLGKTVVLATNLLEEAWSICHRVAILRGGEIVAFDEPANLDALRANADTYRITLSRVDDAVISNVRGLSSALEMMLESSPNACTFEVKIARAPDAFDALVRALRSDTVSVLSIDRKNAAPADIFADLVRAE